MRRIATITACLVLMSPLSSIAAFAQVDAGQDVHDAQSYDDNDRDRCNGLHDPACQDKTPMWFRIAWPIGIVSLFFAPIWVTRKIKQAEERKRNRKNG